ncbi:hypothetical protein [Roseovarius amoyensis]|uniref:hypothetical protein n=1 Tax=Roseovarius amoyensis TaxID=2211448 RepID=UPI0013A6D31E|nr:hypothetical protein [Roseovarius amoyensis]
MILKPLLCACRVWRFGPHVSSGQAEHRAGPCRAQDVEALEQACRCGDAAGVGLETLLDHVRCRR